MLTQERLKEVLTYNYLTGIFRWRIAITNRISVNDVAGSWHSNGYLQIAIDNKKYYSHKLAWFYMYNFWPIEIDHKDTIKHHNWIDNLREADRQQNTLNVKVKSNSSTGLKNVYFEKRRNKYRVSVRANEKRNFVGYFLTEIEANNAAESFMKEHHKEWYAEAELKDGIVVKVS